MNQDGDNHNFCHFSITTTKKPQAADDTIDLIWLNCIKSLETLKTTILSERLDFDIPQSPWDIKIQRKTNYAGNRILWTQSDRVFLIIIRILEQLTYHGFVVVFNVNNYENGSFSQIFCNTIFDFFDSKYDKITRLCTTQSLKKIDSFCDKLLGIN